MLEREGSIVFSVLCFLHHAIEFEFSSDSARNTIGKPDLAAECTLLFLGADHAATRRLEKQGKQKFTADRTV